MLATRDPWEAYLFGCVSGNKMKIPSNKLVTLFGAPGCGKSYLIRLVARLKGKSIDEIKTLLHDEFINDEEAFKIKELVDSCTIVPKKTTRKPRASEKEDKPEIIEGVSRDEVEACDFTYEYGGNLYGFSKEDIDEALLDGHALMVVNDVEGEAFSLLSKAYGHQFKPTFVHRAADDEDWKQNMLQGNRSPEEIKNRMSLYWESRKMYSETVADIAFPETILNKPDLEGFNDKVLLLQLKRLVDPERRYIGPYNKDNEK